MTDGTVDQMEIYGARFGSPVILPYFAESRRLAVKIMRKNRSIKYVQYSKKHTVCNACMRKCVLVYVRSYNVCA